MCCARISAALLPAFSINMDEVSPYSRSALVSNSRISATVTICMYFLLAVLMYAGSYVILPNLIVMLQEERRKRLCYTPPNEKTRAQNHTTTQHPICQHDRETGGTRVARQPIGNRYQANRCCDISRSGLSVSNSRRRERVVSMPNVRGYTPSPGCNQRGV